MDIKPFHIRRRQQFLTEELYEKTRANQFDLIRGGERNIALSDSAQESASVHHFLFLEPLWIWLLDYTAGVPIAELAPRVAGLVDAFEKWNEVDQLYQQEAAKMFPEYGPYAYRGAPDFPILSDYIDTLQLLSIAIVLRDRHSVERIIHVLRSHRGEDGLFETLISAYVDDEQEIETCVLGEPFETLLQAYYTDDNADLSREAVEQYLKKWYPAMKYHPRWYDGHLHTSKDGSSAYYGYWAFEAAAVVFLLDLDDRVINHMVYPKDLVAYGKQLRAEGRYTSLGDAATPRTGRCEGGQPCPFAGWWFTPAQADSRRHFAQGEVMPDFKGSWGATIWQFDAEQGEA